MKYLPYVLTNLPYIGKDSSSLRPIWGIKEFSFVTSKISFEIGPSQHLWTPNTQVLSPKKYGLVITVTPKIWRLWVPMALTEHSLKTPTFPILLRKKIAPERHPRHRPGLVEGKLESLSFFWNITANHGWWKHINLHLVKPTYLKKSI